MCINEIRKSWAGNKAEKKWKAQQVLLQDFPT